MRVATGVGIVLLARVGALLSPAARCCRSYHARWGGDRYGRDAAASEEGGVARLLDDPDLVLTEGNVLVVGRVPAAG